MSSTRRASLSVNSLRRSPRRSRTKTPSINELSNKFKISPRGKRRLEFQQEKPLKGQTFYFDVQGYRGKNTLQTRIKQLGGIVEEFLSKDISFVVTNKRDVDLRCSPRSHSTPSPGMSIPSPHPGNNNSSSAKGSAAPSPLSADSSCSAEHLGHTAPRHATRGKALAKQAAVTCRYGTSNVIANARNWGLEIVHLDKLLEKLERYGGLEKKSSTKSLVSERVAKKSVQAKVRPLNAPFIKVEDHSRSYKPLVHELKEWPKIYFDGPLGSCPFDSPKKHLGNELEGQAKDQRKHVQEEKNKKKGFCECCCAHYEDLDLHLRSELHQSFARNPSNYRNLDELISGGPSLQEFLAKLTVKHQKREKDERNGKEMNNYGTSCVQGKEKTPTKQGRHELHVDIYTPVNNPKERSNYEITRGHVPEEGVHGDIASSRFTQSSRTELEIQAVGLKSDGQELRKSPRTTYGLKEKPLSPPETKPFQRSQNEADNQSIGDSGHAERLTRSRTRHSSVSPVDKHVISQVEDTADSRTEVTKKLSRKRSRNAKSVQQWDENVAKAECSSESSGKENYDPSFEIRKQKATTYNEVQKGGASLPYEAGPTTHSVELEGFSTGPQRCAPKTNQPVKSDRRSCIPCVIKKVNSEEKINISEESSPSPNSRRPRRTQAKKVDCTEGCGNRQPLAVVESCDHRASPASKENTKKCDKLIVEEKTKLEVRKPSAAEVKFSDCRSSLSVQRPIIEAESDDDSTTVSIQFSSKENSTEQTLSDKNNDTDVSSTSTLQGYLSSPGSGKSEQKTVNRYILRKRTQPEGRRLRPRKRTRFEYQSPNGKAEDIQKRSSRRRSTMTTAFTCLKSRKGHVQRQRSKSTNNAENKTPEKRSKQRRYAMVAFDNTTYEDEDELNSSLCSDSPQSGPISQSGRMNGSSIYSSVRGKKERITTEQNARKRHDNVILREPTYSENCNSNGALMNTLRGSPGKEKTILNCQTCNNFTSVALINSEQKKQAKSSADGVTDLLALLFDSDNDDQDFYGFEVPQFEAGSFSSELDLSFRINSIVENMSSTTGCQEVEKTETSEIHMKADRKEENTETASQEKCDTKREEESCLKAIKKCKEQEIANKTEKQRSGCMDSTSVATKVIAECGASICEMFCSVVEEGADSDGTDDEGDDDVFSSVADSSNGEEEDQVKSPFSFPSWRPKRKSEDIKPEVERPAKRRKSCDQGDCHRHGNYRLAITSFANVASSAQKEVTYTHGASRQTPVKSRFDELIGLQKGGLVDDSGGEPVARTQICTINAKPALPQSVVDFATSNTSDTGKECSSSSKKSDWKYLIEFDADEPVFQTIEERVKLRRIKNTSETERNDVQSYGKDDKTHLFHAKASSSDQKEEHPSLPPLKPLRKRLEPLKPLKQVTPVSTASMSLRSRAKSTPTTTPFLSPTHTRKATWIYNVNEFLSQSSAANHFSGDSSTCSTPGSRKSRLIGTFKRVNELHKKERQSRYCMPVEKEKDAFAFDE